MEKKIRKKIVFFTKKDELKKFKKPHKEKTSEFILLTSLVTICVYLCIETKEKCIYRLIQNVDLHQAFPMTF